MRIAQVRQFPIENRGDLAVFFEEIAGAVVAMHDRHKRRNGRMVFEPADAPFGQRVGAHRPAFDLRLPVLYVLQGGVGCRDMVCHVRHGCDGFGLPRHPVQRRQQVDELLAQANAQAVFQRRRSRRHPRHHGLARRLLAEQEGCAQNAGILAVPIDAWHRHGTAFERLQRQHLGRCLVGREQAVVRAEAQNQILGAAIAIQPGHRHGIGQPRKTDGETPDGTHLNGMIDLG